MGLVNGKWDLAQNSTNLKFEKKKKSQLPKDPPPSTSGFEAYVYVRGQKNLTNFCQICTKNEKKRGPKSSLFLFLSDYSEIALV